MAIVHFVAPIDCVHHLLRTNHTYSFYSSLLGRKNWERKFLSRKEGKMNIKSRQKWEKVAVKLNCQSLAPIKRLRSSQISLLHNYIPACLAIYWQYDCTETKVKNRKSPNRWHSPHWTLTTPDIHNTRHLPYNTLHEMKYSLLTKII